MLVIILSRFCAQFDKPSALFLSRKSIFVTWNDTCRYSFQMNIDKFDAQFSGTHHTKAATIYTLFQLKTVPRPYCSEPTSVYLSSLTGNIVCPRR